MAEFVAPTLTVNGRELTADEYRQVPSALTTAFPDAQGTIDQPLCDGDTTTLRITARGTHQGALLGIPPTGRPVSFLTLGTYRIRAGKIIEVWAARDMLGVAHQLGATLMPPTDT